MSRAGPRAVPYPRFSDAEMQTRRRALEKVMAECGVHHAVIYGANRFGSAVEWLTRWPVTREALVVFSPGERDVLLVNFYNHLPNAARIATEAEVRWAGATMDTALGELERRAGRDRCVGVIGSLEFEAHAKLDAFASTVIDLNGAYTELRLVKSAEEIEWLRLGAGLTDAAVRRLHNKARPGMSEAELADVVERAYVAQGGSTHIHYFGVTPMRAPSLAVPAQWPSARTLEKGDVLTCEISASFWGYPGQLLRTFVVDEEPSRLYSELHEVADAAVDAILRRLRPGTTAEEVVEAASVIEDGGFTTRDDLVHGFVGGYLPPVLGSRSRTLQAVPDFTFERGMTIVVQPNVVSRDEMAGVQTGQLVVVGKRGPEPLHDYERGLLRIG